MKRRDFSALLASAPLAGATGAALAQGGPVEGRQYTVLSQPSDSGMVRARMECCRSKAYSSPVMKVEKLSTRPPRPRTHLLCGPGSTNRLPATSISCLSE